MQQFIMLQVFLQTSIVQFNMLKLFSIPITANLQQSPLNSDR